jgi:adenylylsulfate kinase
LPSSGKTTIANMLRMELQHYNINIELLDGDTIRKELSPELGFTKLDRDIHARRVVFLCKILLRHGIPSIVSLISPYRELRNFARIEIGNFIEVFVNCPLEICIRRDLKGLYKKALTGEIKDLTGIQDPYESPLNPEVIVNTEKEEPYESVEKIVSFLKKSKFLQSIK